jgi:outer membrane protein TolC
MYSRISISFYAVAAALVVSAGCNSFDGQKVRQQHVESYRQSLDQKAVELLSADEPLTLKDCLRIALKNNLDIRVAEVQQRVAELSRKASFAQFLPRVNFNYEYTRWDPQPEIITSGTPRPMHDERIREMTWNIQMSIFKPSTWFMYSMHERGEEIAELVTDYTRQMIVLQVTNYYYYCLGIGEIEKVLDSRIRAAEKLAEQLQNFQAEGLVFPWQSDQARTNLESQKLQKQRVRHILEQTKGQLLIAMGLSPLDSLKLDSLKPVTVLHGSMEDFITKALLNHPRLRIFDRKITIEEEKVKLALAGFLPSLTGFAERVNTTDSFQRYSNYWMMGLSGVLTVFNGFENIHEYDAAKENVKKAALEREQATLALMLEVFRAYQNLELVKYAAGVAQNNYIAASKHYDQVYQQWQEGLLNASDLLSVVAERDLAQMVIINSQFQIQVAIATLINTIGQTETRYEEAQHDGQSQER